jgi:hypothetical protein
MARRQRVEARARELLRSGPPAPDPAVEVDAAADAAAVFHVSEAAVSAPDCAAAGALKNATSSIAAIDTPKA